MGCMTSFFTPWRCSIKLVLFIMDMLDLWSKNVTRREESLELYPRSISKIILILWLAKSPGLIFGGKRRALEANCTHFYYMYLRAVLGMTTDCDFSSIDVIMYTCKLQTTLLRYSIFRERFFYFLLFLKDSFS